MSALLYLPVVITLAAQGRFSGAGVAHAIRAGVLSSVVPYAADLIALRRVPARFFGLFMSVHPVLAAGAGLILLGQRLGPHEWAGIALVIAANAVAVSTHTLPVAQRERAHTFRE